MLTRTSRLLPIILLVISLLLFFLTLQATYKKIGTTHPGYLTFQNGVVGAFYLPSWSGHKQGISYHNQVEPLNETNEAFSLKDFFLIVIFPAISGILFVLLGIGLSLYLPYGPGRFVLMLFHFFAGNYLILSLDFHLTYQFSVPLF